MVPAVDRRPRSLQAWLQQSTRASARGLRGPSRSVACNKTGEEQSVAPLRLWSRTLPTNRRLFGPAAVLVYSIRVCCYTALRIRSRHVLPANLRVKGGDEMETESHGWGERG
jgi:hypothetical protein